MLASHPAAFVVVVCYVAVWLISSFETFDWHAVATDRHVVRGFADSEGRASDTQAIHAKLDELLRVEGSARNELTQIDHQEPEAIERHRSEEHEADH